MVDVVNYQVGRGTHNHTVHLDGFAILFANGVESFAAELGEPLEPG